MFFSSVKKLPETVKERTGFVFLPPSTRKPSLWREKSPLMGLAPAWVPPRKSIHTPLPHLASSASSVSPPGARTRV